MKERVLAIVGALALVAVAVLVRQVLRSDSDGDAGDDAPIVACSPDLTAVCDALADDGVIAADPPELTLQAATEPPDEVQAWITWDPAPAIADIDAEADLWDEPTALGSAPLAILTTPPATEALAAACGDDPTWGCVLAVDEAAASVGLGPLDTAAGLARIAELAAAATTGLDPAGLDRSRLAQLLDSPTGGPDEAGDSVTALVVQGPGAFASVVVPEGLAADAAETGRSPGLAVVRPDGTRAATVVIAGRNGADTSDAVTACRSDPVSGALTEVGVVACEGTVDDGEMAGFLWQVRERVG